MSRADKNLTKMNSSIYKTLKDNLVNASNQNNRSTVELCITELSSGNFPKAVDLSEELIKKDINDSVGWATKALSQAHLFDYQNNLYFLKSSLTSIEEFKAKTSLSSKEIMTVEAIFATTVLDRTITIVTERVEEVIELRRKAMVEKTKAIFAAIGAGFSAYQGSQSESDAYKMFGYAGAIAGATASDHFNSNAELLKIVSKGVFGVAIANISMTIGIAMTLKSNLNELDFAVRDEATTTLKNWINTLAFLYQQVIENLLVYCKELKRKSITINRKEDFTKAAINLINAPEATQFIYLSKILGIENSIPQFKELEAHMLKLRGIDENEIKSSFTKELYYFFGPFILAFIILLSGAENSPIAAVIFIILFFGGCLTPLFFMWKPLGKAGELKQSVKKFVDAMKNFKVTSDRIIIENMIQQD